MKLLNDEKAFKLAVQLLKNDKNIKEELIVNDEKIKAELSDVNENIKAELSEVDEKLTSDINTKAPIKNPNFTGKITVDGASVAMTSEVDEQLRLSEPYLQGHELVANGYGLIIDKIDDNTNRATYYTSGKKKYIDFPSGYSVCGGTVDGNCSSSSIVMNNGNVNILQGGSDGDGSVSDVNIVVNGGTVKSIVGGGYPNLEYSGKANHTGSVNIVIKNIEGNTSIFGGGYSYASVGSVNIEILGGNIQYVSVGGSNGSVGYGCAAIQGGNIDVLQAVNHGYTGHAELIVNDGTVKSVYAGMEPGGSVIGSFGHTTIKLNGGSIGHLYKGQNGSSNDYSNNYISGFYYEDVVSDSDAESLGLKKIIDKHVTVDDVNDTLNSVLTIREF